jgi:rhamnogalacturonyl hydrolase YesR
MLVFLLFGFFTNGWHLSVSLKKDGILKHTSFKLIKPMKYIILLLTIFSLTAKNSVAQQNKYSPIEKIQLVADHIIASNPFQYELKPAAKKNSLNELNFVDFGRTFGQEKPAVAYALSWLNSPVEQDLEMDLEFNNSVKIFLNDKQVYSGTTDQKVKVEIHERSVELSEKVILNLKRGLNKLLIKSETTGGRKWAVYLKTNQTENLPKLGLQDMKLISEDLANFTNWLVIGPFNSSNQEGLETVYPPESVFETGKLYDGADGPVTWTIPKIEILADAKPIDPIWGSYLNFNYHTAGVAWAMMHLSEFSGEKRFDNYAKKYTDFMIETKPFVRYQMEDLNEYYSVNYHMVDVPLLDFTLAPALPFVYRLNKENSFKNRNEYEDWVNQITAYAINQQVRLNGKNFTRLTPKVYTTWVDDMYMGLPFLTQAAKLTTYTALRKKLFDDAASQVFSFNEQVWDEEAQLYQHAQYSERKVKMPHWSRANGWGIWAVSEILLELPKSHPRYKAILKHYQNHVKSLVRFQDNDGFWKNILDVESVQETSGTAIFTMAIARGINQGWLKRKDYEDVVLKGWSALDSVIDEDGTVHKICMGTMCSEDLNYYLERPIVDDDSHGMLGLIMAAIEVQKMMDTK